MFRMGLFAVGLILVTNTSTAQQCSAYNTPWSKSQQYSDTSQHTAPGTNHWALMGVSGSCTYAAQPATNNCKIQCNATLSAQGATEVPPAQTGPKHTSTYTTTLGSSGSNGPQTNCGAQEGVAVRSCPVTVGSCDITVTMSGSVFGIGGSVTYSAPTIWSPVIGYNETCGSRPRIPPKSAVPATRALPPAQQRCRVRLEYYYLPVGSRTMLARRDAVLRSSSILTVLVST